MADNIKELMDEVAQKIEALTLGTEPALKGVSVLEEFVTGFITDLNTTGEDIKGKFQETMGRVEEAQSNFETVLEASHESIGMLQGAVTEAASKVEELVHEITEQLASAKSKADDMVSQVKEQAESCKEQVTQLTEDARAFEEEITSQWEEAEGKINGFMDTLSTARSAFEEKKGELITQYGEFEDAAKERLSTLVDTFGSVMEEASGKLDAFLPILESSSGQAMTLMTTKFTQEAIEALTGGAGGLDEGMGFLREAGEMSEELLDGKVGDVLDSIDEVVSLIEEIKPVLDMANKLLG